MTNLQFYAKTLDALEAYVDYTHDTNEEPYVDFDCWCNREHEEPKPEPRAKGSSSWSTRPKVP
jgi:hypothetical protein